DGLLDDRGHARKVGGGGLGDEAGAVGQHVEQRVHRLLQAAVERGGGDPALLGGGRELALGQAVDLVVHDHVGDVHVAPDRVGDVAAADGEAVAVAARRQHQEVRVGHLDALGDGQGPAVDAVEAVGGGVAGDAAGAADAGDEGDLV